MLCAIAQSWTCRPHTVALPGEGAWQATRCCWPVTDFSHELHSDPCLRALPAAHGMNALTGEQAVKCPACGVQLLLAVGERGSLQACAPTTQGRPAAGAAAAALHAATGELLAWLSIPGKGNLSADAMHHCCAFLQTRRRQQRQT